MATNLMQDLMKGNGLRGNQLHTFPTEAERKTLMSEEAWSRVLRIVSPFSVLVIWELLVRSGLLDRRFFPEPTSLIDAFIALVSSGVLLEHVTASMSRILAGFALGALPAILIGMLMGFSKWIRHSLQPIFTALYPIPKIAILPLLILIFGLGEMSKIMVVAIAVFFLVLFNTVSGVLNIPSIYRDVGRNFGAGRFFWYRTIGLPGALPFVFTGLRLGMGVSLLVLVAAEFVGANSGIGYMVWQAWQTFQIEHLFVGLAVISALGYVITELINFTERVFVRWHY